MWGQGRDKRFLMGFSVFYTTYLSKQTRTINFLDWEGDWDENHLETFFCIRITDTFQRLTYLEHIYYHNDH